jgi:tRNA 2-thiouridine synthesizing protein E
MAISEESNTLVLNSKSYTLDKFGFLSPSDQWDENFADGMSRRLGIYDGLTEKHWDFLKYLRKKFLEEETVPLVVMACADNKLRLWEFRKLFPAGYHRGACKIAGINYKFMFDVNHWHTYENPPPPDPRFKATPTGFLEDFSEWKEDFAHRIAQEWKIPSGLTERHKEVIGFLRDYYEKNKNIPTVFETCDANDMSLEELMALFPEGYRRGACRIAGLPFFS